MKNYFALSVAKLSIRTGTTRPVQCLAKNLAFARRRTVTKIHAMFVEKPYSSQSSFLQNVCLNLNVLRYRLQSFCNGRHLKFVKSYTFLKKDLNRQFASK